MSITQNRNDAPRHSHPVYQDLDQQLLARLRENEIDLQTELDDLSHEIITREERLIVVMRELRKTREQMAQFLRHVDWSGSAA